MAIQNLAFPELLRYPNWGCYESSSFSTSQVVVDAAGESAGTVFSAPKSGAITKIHFACTMTTSGDVDVRVETVDDATGLNSGTLLDTNTNKKITVSASGLQTATLTSSASVTQGQDIAIVIVGDATSTPWISVLYFGESGPNFPYLLFNSGTPSKIGSVSGAFLWIEYSDGTQPNIPWVRKFTSIVSSALMTNDKRYGIRFQLPFDAKISGWWTQNDYSDNANNTVEIYGADGVTVEKTATVNGNIRQAGPSPCYHLFSTDFNAKARTWYRLTMRTSVNTGSGIYKVDTPDLTETTRFSGHDFMTDDLNLIQPAHYTYTSAAAAPTSENDWVNDYGVVSPMSVLISEISTEGAADWLRFNRGRCGR